MKFLDKMEKDIVIFEMHKHYRKHHTYDGELKESSIKNITEKIERVFFGHYDIAKYEPRFCQRVGSIVLHENRNALPFLPARIESEQSIS